jgi:thiol:disulfide interchange protein
MKTLAILCLVAGSLAASTAPVRWETSLEAAQKRASAEHKLIFLDVSTGWCDWCKKLQLDTFPSSQARAALAKVVPLSIETQDAKSRPTAGNYIEKRFHVEGFPTLLILDADGREVARQPGFMAPRQFAAWITQAVNK